jgi:hypothetical protein
MSSSACAGLRRSLRYQETLMAMKEAGGHAVSCFDVEA